MTLEHLGRRYERLLFFSAPLTLVTIAVLLIVFTSTTQSERVLAKCLDVAVETLRVNDTQLNSKWDQYQAAKKKTKYVVNEYVSTLRTIWISPGIHSGCHKEIEPFLEKGADTPPSSLQASLALRASDLKNTPLQFRGIEIPQKAEVGILGTNIKINLDSLAAALQISLAPLLMIWLGSLYNTRHRESWLIGKANDISVIFPHLINIYPAINVPTLRKRSRLAFWLPPAALISIIYSLTRLCLIAVIIGPAVASYLISLFLLSIDDIAWVSFISGGLVAMFALSVLAVELFPWHAMKIFPGIKNV